MSDAYYPVIRFDADHSVNRNGMRPAVRIGWISRRYVIRRLTAKWKYDELPAMSQPNDEQAFIRIEKSLYYKTKAVRG